MDGDGETGGQTDIQEIRHANSVWEASEGGRWPKNARPIIYGHCKFSLDNRGDRDKDGGADSDRLASLSSHLFPEDNSLVGGRFNRCNFNLLAFRDSTQSQSASGGWGPICL